jgi:SsrA-binding protein
MEPIRNKKAFFDYEHLETFEAGLVLTGDEVKAVKMHLMNLEGSYVRIKDGEAWLVGTSIARYPKAAFPQQAYDATRSRKLLLTKKELRELNTKLATRGLTVVPCFVYSTRRLVKIRIALARGKRKFDKRETIKKREFQRRLNVRVR